MDRTPSRTWLRRGHVGPTLIVVLALVVAVVLTLVAAVHRAATGGGASVRALDPKEHHAATQALREARGLMQRYRRLRRPPVARTPEEAEEFEAAATAFKRTLAQYPGTEIEFECRFGLSTLHQYRGQWDQASQALREADKRFAGTPYASRVWHRTGLAYLQGFHDPASAIPWLEKIPAPPGADEDGVVPEEAYDQAQSEYVAVQQTLMRCEVQLGRPQGATRRCEALARRYPQYRDSVNGMLESYVTAALTNHTLTEVHPVLADWHRAREEAKRRAEEALWGQAVDGLRASIGITPPELRVGDTFTVVLRVKNVSDRTKRLRYWAHHVTRRLLIRNGETGEEVPYQVFRMCGMGSGNPADSLRAIEPGAVFEDTIPGRMRFPLAPAADTPSRLEERAVAIECGDLRYELGRLAPFSAQLCVTVDERQKAFGGRVGLKDVWVGRLLSNELSVQTRLMTPAEQDEAARRIRKGTRDERRAAIDFAGASANPHAVPVLMSIVVHREDPQFASWALDALWAIQDGSIVPELRALYRLWSAYPDNDSDGVLWRVLRTIEGLTPDPRASADMMLAVLRSDARPAARGYAASVLSRSDHPERLPAIIKVATEPNPEAQKSVLDVLTSMLTTCRGETAGMRPRIMAAMLRILRHDPDKGVRSWAARHLADARDPAAMPGLIGALTDPEAEVRGYAAQALGRTGDATAVPSLLRALDDTDRWVGRCAVGALGALAGPNAIPAIERFAEAAGEEAYARDARRAVDVIRRRAAREEGPR